MKASTLRAMIFELRDGSFFELEDKDLIRMRIDGMDDGWRLCTPNNSLIVTFDQVLVSGTDVYLVKQSSEGEQVLFAIMDAEDWTVCEE